MTNTGFTSVPFKAESGLSQIDGIGKFSPAGVVLEFESKLFGILKNGVKEAKIALDEILDVKFRKGFFRRGVKVEIRLKSFARLSELPNKDGKLVLKISADDFERAREAVERLNKVLTARRDAPPLERSPVSRIFEEYDEEENKTPKT